MRKKVKLTPNPTTETDTEPEPESESVQVPVPIAKTKAVRPIITKTSANQTLSDSSTSQSSGKRSRSHTAVPTITSIVTLKMNEYEKQVSNLRTKIGSNLWDDLFCIESVTQAQREEAWTKLCDLGYPLCNKYSWAIPNHRALNICKAFAPLIEIGAGKGYWAHLLQSQGVDIVAIDKYTSRNSDNWSTVQYGGPEALKVKGKKGTSLLAQGRNLLLSYPDENESVAMECLDEFQGDHIIHVGELMITSTKTGGMQCPWGRTTSSEFQVALAEQFHCVLMSKLPSYPFANDYITVWTRSTFINIEEEEEDFENDDEEGEVWRGVPAEERLPDLTRACPKHAHLLA